MWRELKQNKDDFLKSSEPKLKWRKTAVPEIIIFSWNDLSGLIIKF